MTMQNYWKGLSVILLLALFIIFITSSKDEHLQRATLKILSFARNSSLDDVKQLPNYKIEGMDRFEWYTKQWKKKLKDEEPPEIEEVSMLTAYEFDVEYSISITTPGKFKAIVYCRYFDEFREEMLPSYKSQNFPEHVVNCPKRKGTKYISVSTQDKNNYTYPIPFVDRTQRGYKHEFSFCMSPIYGKEPKWLLIAEIIEHYKLQGVTHFYFYVFHIDEYSNAILEDYVRTGEVKVTYLLERDDRRVMNWQRVAFRDCTLKSRYHSKWSLFADIDERLLMTNGTILDYLRDAKDNTIAAIQFRQQWVMKTEFLPKKYESDKQLDKWMPTLRWHNSSVFGPPNHTVKCIVMPEKVLAMGTHYPRMLFPGFHIHSLTPEEGIVRHYRDLQMWNWGKLFLREIMAFGPMSMTDYPARYQKTLTAAVKKRTKYVYENYSIKEY